MKFFLSVLAIVLALAGCGGGESTTTEEFSQKRTEELLGPEIAPPPGPPPKKLVIEDLEAGSGPVAKRGDEVAVHYVGVFYETGEVLGRRWKALQPAVFRLGASSYGRGLEEGIEGMKAGGRRELIIPARLAPSPELGALVYVVSLASVEPAGP
jgi:peptidylprolyl isomerase